MIYMAAKPAQRTYAFVGERCQLSEVRCVSLAEARALMEPYGMFAPVRHHLPKRPAAVTSNL